MLRKCWFCRWHLLLLVIGIMMVTITLSDDLNTDDDNDDGGWNKLEISPNVIVSIPYFDFRINVYKHANLNKYYYAPVSLLNHWGAVSSFNNVTQEAEMKFRIELWNDAIQKNVTEWIKQEIDSTVKDNFIQVIPFEKLILMTSSLVTNSEQSYQLTKEWTPYQLQKSVRFKLICYALSDCDNLAQQMRHNADQFSHFRLLFSVSSQKSKTKLTIIRVENMLRGKMASTLLQRLPNAESVLLTANDEKRLFTESATNIIIDTIDDSNGVISPNSEAQIYQLLRDNLLAPSRTIIKDQSDKMWESVFWDEDNYRPDKTTKTWNEIYKKLDKEKQNKLIETYEKVVQGGIGWKKFGINFDFLQSENMSSESIEKLIEESRETVEWNGVKFEPKPLSLSRLNLAKLRDTQTFRDCSTRVTYSKAVLSVAVNIRRQRDGSKRKG